MTLVLIDTYVQHSWSSRLEKLRLGDPLWIRRLIHSPGGPLFHKIRRALRVQRVEFARAIACEWRTRANPYPYDFGPAPATH